MAQKCQGTITTRSSICYNVATAATATAPTDPIFFNANALPAEVGVLGFEGGNRTFAAL